MSWHSIWYRHPWIVKTSVIYPVFIQRQQTSISFFFSFHFFATCKTNDSWLTAESKIVQFVHYTRYASAGYRFNCEDVGLVTLSVVQHIITEHVCRLSMKIHCLLSHRRTLPHRTKALTRSLSKEINIFRSDLTISLWLFYSVAFCCVCTEGTAPSPCSAPSSNRANANSSTEVKYR